MSCDHGGIGLACTEVDRTSEITFWLNTNDPWTQCWVGWRGEWGPALMIVCADIILLVKTVFMHFRMNKEGNIIVIQYFL